MDLTGDFQISLIVNYIMLTFITMIYLDLGFMSDYTKLFKIYTEFDIFIALYYVI